MATASVALPTNLSKSGLDRGLLDLALWLDRPTARPLAEVCLRLKVPAYVGEEQKIDEDAEKSEKEEKDSEEKENEEEESEKEEEEQSILEQSVLVDHICSMVPWDHENEQVC